MLFNNEKLKYIKRNVKKERYERKRYRKSYNYNL